MAEVLAPAVIGFIAAAIVLIVAEFCIFHWLRTDAAHFDASVRAAIHAQASPPLTEASIAVTLLGKYPLPVFALVLFLFLWRRGLRLLACFPLAAFVSAAVLLELAKEIVRRVRPHPWFGFPTPTSWSFPSGHSLDSTTCYLVFAVVLMAVVRRRLPRGFILAVGIALPLMIGFTRVYLGVHWPTDVLAGWVAGFCLAVGLIASQRRVARHA
jgi:undecaprenyl-diphosphatase